MQNGSSKEDRPRSAMPSRHSCKPERGFEGVFQGWLLVRKVLEPKVLVPAPRSPVHGSKGHRKMKFSVACSCVEVL